MILCLGTTPTVQRSMTFDRVKISDVNRAVEVNEYASGKSPNVARALHTMGAGVLAVGFAGGDRGRFLLADLAAAGIACDFVNVPEQTRLCTTVIDRANGTATELVEEHAPLQADSWEQMHGKLSRLLPTAETWVFSGSLPPGAPQDFYARWIPLARQRGARLILDTRGKPLQLALAHGGFIAKLNRDELAGTLGVALENDQAVIDAARKIMPQGGAAIITHGSHGVLACHGRHVWHVTPPRIKAISAVGSGDAFAAGLALGLSQGSSMPESLALAAACGAANALTALAGHLNAQEVARLRSQVQIREMTA